MNAKMRASSFAVFGALSNYGIGELKEAFVEQVYNSVSSIVKKCYHVCAMLSHALVIFSTKWQVYSWSVLIIFVNLILDDRSVELVIVINKFLNTHSINDCFSQVHAAIPRLVLHLHDEDVSVRLACRVISHHPGFSLNWKFIEKFLTW